jgi:hypothetical protein
MLAEQRGQTARSFAKLGVELRALEVQIAVGYGAASGVGLLVEADYGIADAWGRGVSAPVPRSRT